MIKINKLPKPEVLADNEEQWTDEYIRRKSGDLSIPKAAETRYRHPDIKSTLRLESHDKCIFCESKISHVFPGETDHIIPSSKRPEYIVKWDNLGYVCKECNRNKHNYYDERIPLLNPFVDEPKEYLLFVGPLVFPKPGRIRGTTTVEKLKLDRSALIERKKERLQNVQLLLERLELFPHGSAREFLLEEIEAEADSSREYSATVRQFLNQALAEG